MTDSTGLRVNGLSLSFGGLRVLNQVSFFAPARSLLALVGPNGAGKTSVFNVISGLYQADGEVTFQGENLVGLPAHEIARRGVARTFQHGELFPQMTVYDNILIGRHAHFRSSIFDDMFRTRLGRTEENTNRAFIQNVISFVGLQRFQHEIAEDLPLGVQKMIDLARSLAQGPKLLLLDEPSSGLTSKERQEFTSLLLKIKMNLGVAILWIEHDMQMVAALADSVVVLDTGRVLATGGPEVLKHTDVVRAYVGIAEN